MQGQLVDLRDAYKAIRKALFIKQGQGCECIEKECCADPNNPVKYIEVTD